jgi:hypothetical protein
MSTPTTRVSHPFARPVGAAALIFSALYFVSDVMELIHGGFSTPQLVLTYVAEAAIPIFVLGLYVVQRPHIGTLGLLGAIGYAYAYIFFTGTVLLALADQSSDWDALVADLGPWVTLHGLLMVLAGTALGMAVIRAEVLPRWTGGTLILGVILVAGSSTMPDLAQTLSAGVRDLAFAAMGFSLLTTPSPTTAAHAGIRLAKALPPSTIDDLTQLELGLDVGDTVRMTLERAGERTTVGVTSVAAAEPAHWSLGARLRG